MIGNMNAVVEICTAACNNRCCCITHSAKMPYLLDKVIDCLTRSSEAEALLVDMKIFVMAWNLTISSRGYQ